MLNTRISIMLYCFLAEITMVWLQCCDPFFVLILVPYSHTSLMYINLRRSRDCLLCMSDPRFIQFVSGSCYDVHVNALSI